MSPPPGGFLDTNVLVYAFTSDPRGSTARALLERDFVISVQGLNEFANVARRKLAMSWAEVGEALSAIARCAGPSGRSTSRPTSTRSASPNGTAIRSSTR